MRIALARPSFFSHTATGEVFDYDALLNSFTRDDKSWNPTVSSESAISVSGEYIELSLYNPTKDTHIRLDADRYNSIKKTKYKLPYSVNLTTTDIPSGLFIDAIGLPRDRTVSVEMYGYE